MGAIETKVFKSGNSAAVRLPRELGFVPGASVRIEKVGKTLHITAASEDLDAIKVRLEQLAADLVALGPVGEIEERPGIEFPDRPGLY